MRLIDSVCLTYMKEYVRFRCEEIRATMHPRDMPTALRELYAAVNKDCDAYGLPRIPVPLYLVLSTEPD